MNFKHNPPALSSAMADCVGISHIEFPDQIDLECGPASDKCCTFNCKFNSSSKTYDCPSFVDLVNMLNAENLPSNVNVAGKFSSTGKQQRFRSIGKIKGTKLFVLRKKNLMVKLKKPDIEIPAELLKADLLNSSLVQKDIETSLNLKKVVVPHVDIVPGHFTIMQRCATDAWDDELISSDTEVLNYAFFGIYALACLVSLGYENRDYKASNVGRRRDGSYCMIDTSSILKLQFADRAVCTYPACKEWTFGKPQSYVGYAASAWAFIADFCTMCSFDATTLAHETVAQRSDEMPEAPSTTTPLEYTYCTPLHAKTIKQWSRKKTGKPQNVLSCFIHGLVDDFESSFDATLNEPLTHKRAQHDASCFFAKARQRVLTAMQQVRQQ